MIYKGCVRKFGNNVNTDDIIPARYLNTINPEELAKHIFEDMDKVFHEKFSPGDIVVAGKNFGCGSSREHAPIALKAAGFSCIVAESYGRIFYRNSINIGLPIFVLNEATDMAKEGEELEIMVDKGIIENLTTGTTFHTMPFPPFMQELIVAGGLMKYIEKKLKAKS